MEPTNDDQAFADTHEVMFWDNAFLGRMRNQKILMSITDAPECASFADEALRQRRKRIARSGKVTLPGDTNADTN